MFYKKAAATNLWHPVFANHKVQLELTYNDKIYHRGFPCTAATFITQYVSLTSHTKIAQFSLLKSIFPRQARDKRKISLSATLGGTVGLLCVSHCSKCVCWLGSAFRQGLCGACGRLEKTARVLKQTRLCDVGKRKAELNFAVCVLLGQSINTQHVCVFHCKKAAGPIGILRHASR